MLDRSAFIAITVLALLDFMLTAEGLSRGLREFNPFISAFGLWVYPVLYLLGVFACWALDKLASKLGVDFQPSRLLILIYIITVGNNAVLQTH